MANIYQDPKIEKLINDGFTVDISSYYSKAWKHVKENIGLYLGYTVIYCIISGTLGLIPVFGSLVSMVLSPALIIGYFIVAHKITRSEPVTFSSFFEGFSKFGELFLVYLVMIIFVIAGFILLIIPGIYLAVAYSFALPLVWFLYNGSILDTLKTSRMIISKNWFSFFGFYIIGFFVMILGLLCLGVGIFVAIPVFYVAHYFMYMDVLGTEELSIKNDPFDQLVPN